MICRARIPIRLGYSTGFFSRSYWRLTHPRVQERFRAEKSQGEYDLDLTEYFIACITGRSPRGRPLSELEIPFNLEAGRKALAPLRLDGLPFVLIHPGGNEKQSPRSQTYLEIIDNIRGQAQLEILVSVGPLARDEPGSTSLARAAPHADSANILKDEAIRIG